MCRFVTQALLSAVGARIVWHRYQLGEKQSSRRENKTGSTGEKNQQKELENGTKERGGKKGVPKLFMLNSGMAVFKFLFLRVAHL